MASEDTVKPLTIHRIALYYRTSLIPKVHNTKTENPHLETLPLGPVMSSHVECHFNVSTAPSLASVAFGLQNWNRVLATPSPLWSSDS